jgi:exonuclease SbcD
MVTGATFSSGQQAVGDDLEMPLSALRAAKCDYVALGHVHRMQVFGSDVAYCGSPGRLNFGEPEEKCLLLVDVKHGESPVITAVPTPARRFVFIEADIDSLHAEIAAVADQINGAHVRVRFTVPEERRHEIDREAIEAHLLLGGAVAVKVEGQVIPMTRQRAAGISHVTTLAAKVQRWGTAVGVEIPERVLLIASEIEGLEVTELQAKFCGEEGSRAQFSEVA